MKKNKFMVMGFKRHGKDTFCELLEKKYGVKFAASSEFACELFLFDVLNKKHGLNYTSVEDAFNDRGNHREIWYQEIKAYNVENGLDALGKEIFKEHDIYCGIRDDEEFNCLKEGGHFQFSVWIDASERLPAESEKSNKINHSMANMVIDNNGSLEKLEKQVDYFYHKVYCSPSYSNCAEYN